jgi:Protein of unknown function (DUF3617)
LRDLELRLPRLGFVLVLVLACASATARSEDIHTIDPGYWSYHASTLLTGGKNGSQCVPPEKIDEFISGPHNRHYRCTYPVRVLKDGDATFVGECVDKGKNRFVIDLKGHYKPEAFDLKGKVSGRIFGVAISVPVSIEARKLASDCPGAPN